MASFSIPKTMKALVKTKEEASYSYKEVAVPDPKAGEALLRVDCVAICGSDIALYRWDAVAKVIASIPFIPGHECAGTVVKCGPGVERVAVGDKVGVENHFYCGQCFQCKYVWRWYVCDVTLVTCMSVDPWQADTCVTLRWWDVPLVDPSATERRVWRHVSDWDVLSVDPWQADRCVTLRLSNVLIHDRLIPVWRRVLSVDPWQADRCVMSHRSDVLPVDL